MASADYGKVAVLYGGLSSEREVSLKSGAAVLAALRARGVDATAIDVGRDVMSRLSEGSYDRAFIALHGKYGEDGVVQALLEWMGLPYTGSGLLASSLGMDKLRTKFVLKASGIPVAEHVLLRGPDDFLRAEQHLGLPAIVKPSRQGSSIGVGKVRTRGDWARCYAEAARFDSIVFAEAYIGGAELTAAVLDDQVLPVIRLETPNEFYDYEAKYLANSTRYLCPAGLDTTLEAQLREYARQAFDAIGAHGWARVDFMLDAAGRPFVLEINTVPGMTDHSLVPMAAKAAGIDFPDLCLRILRSSEVQR